jgi:predicted DNA-binding protein
MELSKKTTILFPPELHDHLVRLSQRMGISLGELVRRACEAKYGTTEARPRLEAVRELERLELPVASPEHMAEESVPHPDELLPS